jgi:hypothetical protein
VEFKGSFYSLASDAATVVTAQPRAASGRVVNIRSSFRAGERNQEDTVGVTRTYQDMTAK